MKFFTPLMIALLLILLSYNSFAADETLRHFDPNAQLTYYPSPEIAWEFAAFRPPAPCYIKSITIYFYGSPGTASIFLLGHQAGEALPGTFASTGLVLAGGNYNIPAAEQATPVKIDLEEPIYTANNQFFVAIGNRTQGLYVLSDNVTRQPTCESSSGGNYYYQVLITSAGQWSVGGYAYAAEVTVEYPEKTSKNYLQDITGAVGIPSSSNSRISWADLNGDGYQDLLLGGTVLMNEGGESFTDKTEDFGIDNTSVGGSAFVDFDNDGDLDILVLRSNKNDYELCSVYLNDGHLNFTETILSIPQLIALSGFSIADVDNDGLPDLFICQLWSEYGDQGPDLVPNYFFKNTGTDYELVTGKCQTNPARRSRGCQFTDFDNDGDLDLYVTNYYLEWDELWQNNGDGTFTDIIAQKNIDVNASGHNHGTGVDWYDYDNDGDMDLLLPQFAHPRFLQYDHRGTTIYNNSGAPSYSFTDTFDPNTRQSSLGFEYEETHAGAAWGDVNNDGLADFIITTFYGCRYIDLYIQNENHHFDNGTFEYGIEDIVTGTDAVWVDYNNDGLLDLAMGINGNFRLFENSNDNGNNWIQIDLESTTENKFAIGARVKVYAGDDVYMQEVNCGRGQRMQRPYRLHFGLGQNQTISKIEVRWPNKTEWETFTATPNTIAKLIEGQGGSVPIPDIPVLAEPSDASVNVEKEAVLTWDASANASFYHLQISETDDFSSTVVDEENIQGTSYQTKGLEYNTKYWWRVAAGNASGVSEFSAPFAFNTEDPSSVEGNRTSLFSLNEPIPNPAQTKTAVEFSLGNPAYITLALYDVKGSKIKTLREGLTESGHYKEELITETLPNGVYYISLTHNSGTISKKLVVSR